MGGGGLKKQNLDDVICERYLRVATLAKSAKDEPCSLSKSHLMSSGPVKSV